LAAANPQPLFFVPSGILEEHFMSTRQHPRIRPRLLNCHDAPWARILFGCGKLRQIPQSLDYFALFEMPKKLWIEMEGLERKFLQLS